MELLKLKNIFLNLKFCKLTSNIFELIKKLQEKIHAEIINEEMLRFIDSCRKHNSELIKKYEEIQKISQKEREKRIEELEKQSKKTDLLFKSCELYCEIGMLRNPYGQGYQALRNEVVLSLSLPNPKYSNEEYIIYFVDSMKF